MTRSIPPVHARRTISENRFLSYVEEDLTDRAGKPYTYYQVESKWDAVIVVPVLPDGRLVLERIYRHPYRAYLLEFPAGGIERGEDPLDAAKRELEEETGYVAGRVALLNACEAMPGLLRMRLHVVLAADLTESTQPRKLEAMEMLDVVTMTREQAWSETGKQPVSSFLTMGLLWYERWRAEQPLNGR